MTTTIGNAVELSVLDGIARLALNRPAQGNAINDELCRQLRHCAEGLHERADLRAVVLRAQGDRYCVGGDLAYFQSLTDVEAQLAALAGDFHAAITALRALDAPIVTGVHGVAAGGGLSLVCMCDVVIAARSARFTAAYTAAGLSPDGGLSWFLPRAVGWRNATELLLLNRLLDAEEAKAMGIATSVVPDAELDAEVDKVAGALAAGPTNAYGSVKELLALSAGATLDQQLAREAERIASNAASPNGREGVASFIQKRRPAFTFPQS